MKIELGKVALFGAAGAIGKSIATALRERGAPYRVVGRGRESLEKAFGGDSLAEIVTWNPDDAASVRAAARGVDTLIYLVGVPYNHFELHPVVMRQTLEGAIAEGVKRVVLIGTVYPYGAPQTSKVSEVHPRRAHTFKGKMRKEQEEILLKAHKEAKIQATILRLPDFYGPGVEASFLHRVFVAAVKGGTADMIGPIDQPHEFMYVPDVGPVVLALAERPEAYGRWWNFAGAGTMTQREIAERIFAMVGKKPKLRVAGKTMLRVVGLFNPIMKELVEMNYLMSTPVLMDDSALQGLLGVVKKTSYEEGFKSTLDYYRASATK
jgi:nucleoside-diphosphate-sugar epimerase